MSPQSKTTQQYIDIRERITKILHHEVKDLTEQFLEDDARYVTEPETKLMIYKQIGGTRHATVSYEERGAHWGIECNGVRYALKYFIPLVKGNIHGSVIHFNTKDKFIQSTTIFKNGEPISTLFEDTGKDMSLTRTEAGVEMYLPIGYF